MALTYSTLQTEIANFLNRDDLASQIPTFIDMAEASINRDLRHWRMETKTDVTYNERYEDLPTDWLNTVRIEVGGKTQLDLVSQAKMLELRSANNNTSGEPRYYVHTAGQVELFPTPDGDYSCTIVYNAEVPALDDTTTTNWLLTRYPDVYIYGALVHTAPYLQEDTRVGVWAALYTAAVDKLNRTSMQDKNSGSGLTIR